MVLAVASPSSGVHNGYYERVFVAGNVIDLTENNDDVHTIYPQTAGSVRSANRPLDSWQSRKRKCAGNYNKWHNNFLS